MPIYEYRCTKCGAKFEVRQAMGEDGSKLNCPQCNAPRPERVFSSFFSPGRGEGGSSEISCPTCNTGTCGLPPMP